MNFNQWKGFLFALLVGVIFSSTPIREPKVKFPKSAWNEIQRRPKKQKENLNLFQKIVSTVESLYFTYR